MASSFIKCANVTTSLTRSDTPATMYALAQSILALFKAGGTYDLGIDTARVQWNDASFEVVLEDAVMAGLAANTATLKSTIRTGLLTLSQITALSTADIAPLEMSSISTDAFDAWAFDASLGTGTGRQGYATAGWTVGSGGTYSNEAGYTQITGTAADRCLRRSAAGVITAAGEWELRVKLRIADGASGGADCGVWFDSGVGTLAVILTFISGTLNYFSSGAQYVAVSTHTRFAPDATVVLTVRCRAAGVVTSPGGRLDLWVDDTYAGSVRRSDLWTVVSGYARNELAVGSVHPTVSSSNEVRLDRIAARAGINPCSVSVGLLTGGWL